MKSMSLVCPELNDLGTQRILGRPVSEGVLAIDSQKAPKVRSEDGGSFLMWVGI